MKAIALVIVHGGVADVAAPEHVDVRVIDQDNIEAGDAPPELPRDVGFEELVAQSGMEEGKDYDWELREQDKRTRLTDGSILLRPDTRHAITIKGPDAPMLAETIHRLMKL